MLLDKKTILNYNKIRPISSRGLLCHAPFVSINFEQNGNMTACCYNRSHILGKYPVDTITDAWNGKQADSLRQYIRKNDLGGGCSACSEQIFSGNYSGAKSVQYDHYSDGKTAVAGVFSRFFGGEKVSWPKVFEFELSNKCNLECTMCNGYFSSAIRSKREKLPPLENPYDDAFVEQVKEYLPHLTDAKFLGGEPFLIDIYYKIWDEIIRKKLSTRVHITTNGTIFNERVRSLLEQMNVDINISIDSVNKQTYEQIRIGANYERVMENVAYFIDYAKRKKNYIGLVVCPIQSNWQDMPELVAFCNERDINIHFNTVWTPESVSLRFGTEAFYDSVIDTYERSAFPQSTAVQRNNVAHFTDLKNQIKYWRTLNVSPVAIPGRPAKEEKRFEKFTQQDFSGLDPLTFNILLAEAAFYLKKGSEENPVPFIYDLYKSDTCHIDPEKGLEENLLSLMNKYGESTMIAQYGEAAKIFARKILAENELHSFDQKIDRVTEEFLRLSKHKEIMQELIRTGFVYFFDVIHTNDADTLSKMIVSRYS